jgi:probable rRNA maturation factor
LIRVFNNCGKYRFDKNETIFITKHVIKYESSKEDEVNIVFTDDKFIRKLNASYLKHKWVTDVISFPLSDNKKIEGEIYINLEQSRRQAKAYKCTFKSEIQRLIIHGVLHLIGYKDATQKTKKIMSALEDKYLEKICKKNRQRF